MSPQHKTTQMVSYQEEMTSFLKLLPQHIEIRQDLVYIVFDISIMEGSSEGPLRNMDFQALNYLPSGNAWVGVNMRTKSRKKKNSQPEGTKGLPSITASQNQSAIEANTNPVDSRNSPNVTLILAVITAITTILGALLASPILVPWFQSITVSTSTPVLPTATPVSYARVRSLEVIQGGTVVNSVNPDEFIDVSIGSDVVVRAIVISNVNSANLMFTWDFCEPGNDVTGQGAIEIPYRLTAQGQDCIVLRIEKGGEVLDSTKFFVNIRPDQQTD